MSVLTPIKPISEKLDAQDYGGKAAWLSRMRFAGLEVPDAIALPAFTEEMFNIAKSNCLQSENLLPKLETFQEPNGGYSVAVRSSATIEDGAFESLAGHFETHIGHFSFDELLSHVFAVYEHGFNVLRGDKGKMAVVIQRLIEPTIAGVCFSTNPLTSCRGEMLVSYSHGLAGDLVSGKKAGVEFVIQRHSGTVISSSLPPEFPPNAAEQLQKDIHRLEQLYDQPFDIEWCLDQDSVVHYVQCRPITTVLPSHLGLIPVTRSYQNEFPSAVANHDKVAIRLLCDQRSVYISNAYLHVAYNHLANGEPNLTHIVPSPDCVSFSAVLVYPTRLGGNVVREFAKNDLTDQVCVFRPCVRYTHRELSNHSDLETKVAQIHRAALGSHWLSVVIIQEIFSPKFTGIMMRVDRGVLIELAYGHFVPKGVVPTSFYLLDEEFRVLTQKEIHQKTAYYIEGGEAVARNIDSDVSASIFLLKAIMVEFAPLLKDKSRALEFGVLEASGKLPKPYLIDLVDVAPEAEISTTLLSSGVLSQGVFVGRIEHLSPEYLKTDSLHEHFQSRQTGEQVTSAPVVYHASRPDIGLLRLVRNAKPGSIAFIFDEGSFLSHLAIVLREKHIPALVYPDAARFQQDSIIRMDAASESTPLSSRLERLVQQCVLSYRNPDTDGVIGSLAFSYVKEIGREHYSPVMLGVLDGETQYVLQNCNLDAPNTVQAIDYECRIALVDTHHVSQLPDGLLPEHVCEIIDHHSGGNPERFVNARIQNEVVGAVCTLIAEEMRSQNIYPPPRLAKAMGFAIVSNTLNFAAPSTTNRDRQAFAWLSEIAQIASEEIGQMFRARSELSGRDPYTILQDNSKKFIFGEHSIIISQIEAANVEAMFDNSQTESILRQLRAKEDVQYVVVSMVDPIKQKTIIRVADEQTRILLTRAMNIDFQGFRAEVNRIMLRKTDFIPQIQACLTHGG